MSPSGIHSFPKSGDKNACSCPCVGEGSAVCLPPILDSLCAPLSSFPSSPFLSLGAGPSGFYETRGCTVLGCWMRPGVTHSLAEPVSQCQSLAVATPDQSGSTSVSILPGTLSRA